MATTTDDNAAYEKSDKSIWRLLNIRCTSTAKIKHLLVQRKLSISFALLHKTTYYFIIVTNVFDTFLRRRKNADHKT